MVIDLSYHPYLPCAHSFHRSERDSNVNINPGLLLMCRQSALRLVQQADSSTGSANRRSFDQELAGWKVRQSLEQTLPFKDEEAAEVDRHDGSREAAGKAKPAAGWSGGRNPAVASTSRSSTMPPAAFRRLMTSDGAWGEEEEEGEEGEGQDAKTVQASNGLRELDTSTSTATDAAYRGLYSRRAATSLLLMMATSEVPPALMPTAALAVTRPVLRTSQRSSGHHHRPRELSTSSSADPSPAAAPMPGGVQGVGAMGLPTSANQTYQRDRSLRGS